MNSSWLISLQYFDTDLYISDFQAMDKDCDGGKPFEIAFARFHCQVPSL